MEIHHNCTSNGEEVFCFELIKKIVDGDVSRENISEEQRLLAKKQLAESFELFEMIGVTVEFQEELMQLIS